MNVFQRNHSFWLWYWHVFGVLLRRRFLTTIVVVTLSAASIITSFLAFMLPLKVIILAGSDGVPRYFRFFIDPDQKWDWIILFTVGAIVCYLLTLLFDAITRRLSVSAGSELLESANEFSLIRNQEDVVGGYYGKFCSVHASLVFVLVSMVALALINPLVFSYVIAALTLQFLFTAWVLSGQDDVNPGPLKRYVRDKYKSYLSLLSNFNFLTGFLVILYPYLLSQGGNILLSLISFLLMRRMLTVMADAAVSSVDLEKARLTVNALLFREHQMVEKQSPTLMALRDAFSKQRRTRLVRRVMEELADTGVQQSPAPGSTGDTEVLWQDSPIRSVTTLLVRDGARRPSSGAPGGYFQVQIYPTKQALQLANEQRLFEYLPREQLWAPEVLARFQEARFRCQIVRYGTAKEVGGDWREWESRIFEQLWSTQVPNALKAAYGASHRWPHQRLDQAFVRRLEIAVDTPAERELFNRFMGQLSSIQACLAALPLTVVNPALKPGAVVHDGHGGVLIVSWGQWAIEPIGYSLPRYAADEDLTACLERLQLARKDVPADFDLSAIRFANSVAELERAINKMQYKGALQHMKTILNVVNDPRHPFEQAKSVALSSARTLQ